VLLHISQYWIGRVVGCERAVNTDDQGPAGRLCEDRGFHRANAGNVDAAVPAKVDTIDVETTQIGEQAISSSFETLFVQLGFFAVNYIAKEAHAEVAVEQFVFESVLEATETSVARPVTVRWT